MTSFHPWSALPTWTHHVSRTERRASKRFSQWSCLCPPFFKMTAFEERLSESNSFSLKQQHANAILALREGQRTQHKQMGSTCSRFSCPVQPVDLEENIACDKMLQDPSAVHGLPVPHMGAALGSQKPVFKGMDLLSTSRAVLRVSEFWMQTRPSSCTFQDGPEASPCVLHWSLIQ